MSNVLHGLDRHHKRESGIWIPRSGLKPFSYSDGDEVEARLLHLVSNARDVSLFSKQLREAITDWPTLYHLSAARANLLRPFASGLAGKKILEVGAGCGAVTRFLGESGAEVIAVEGSFTRACIARQRTRDLPNVTVVCDDHRIISAERRFDLVVVIGVLEYARTIVADVDNPELEFLKNLVPALASAGTVIIAIENQLGAKYFAGALEDHTGKSFYGINDQYGPNTVVTFGRRALSRLLEDAGLPRQAWYYPFPDYKLPNSILSDECFRELPSLAPDLIAQNSILDPQRPLKPAFSLEAIWDVLSRNELIGEMANSFLVLARPAGEAALAEPGMLAWHYSASHRHPAFMREVRFEKKNDSVRVLRRGLAKIRPPSVPLRCALVDEAYVVGTNWWSRLVRIVNRPAWTILDVVAWCQFWLDQFTLHTKMDNGRKLGKRTRVAGRYVDLTAFNLFITNGQAGIFIDQEWRLDDDIELGFLVYRNLRASLLRITAVAEPKADTPTDITDLIKAVSSGLGMPFSADDMLKFAERERKFQRWVQGDSEAELDETFVASLRDEKLVRRGHDLSDPGPADLGRLIAEIGGRDRQLVAVNEALVEAGAKADRESRRLIGEIEQRERRLIAADVDLRRLQGEVEARERRLIAADADLRRLMDEIEDRDRRLSEADGDLRRLQGEVEAREGRLIAADADLRRLMNEIEDRDRLLGGADGDLRRLQGEVEARERRLVAADADLRRLMDEIEDRDRRLGGADGDLRRLQGEIEDRERRLIAADADLRRLMDEIEDRDRRLGGADGDLRRLQGEVEDRERRLIAADADLRRLMDEVEDRDRRLQGADGDLRRLMKHVEDRDRRLAVADVDLRRLMAEAGDSNRRLVDASREVKHLVLAIQDRDQQLAVASNEVRRLLEKADIDLSRAKSIIANRDRELGLAGQVLDRLAQEIEERNERLAALQRHLDEIETSTTWRVTAPIRRFFAGWPRALFGRKKR